MLLSKHKVLGGMLSMRCRTSSQVVGLSIDLVSFGMSPDTIIILPYSAVGNRMSSFHVHVKHLKCSENKAFSQKILLIITLYM